MTDYCLLGYLIRASVNERLDKKKGMWYDDLYSKIQVIVGEFQGFGYRTTIEPHWHKLLIQLHADAKASLIHDVPAN